MWDERYNSAEYAFGTEPNDFLVSAVDRLPGGRILCLGEGEGHNAVWLAELKERLAGHHIRRRRLCSALPCAL